MRKLIFFFVTLLLAAFQNNAKVIDLLTPQLTGGSKNVSYKPVTRSVKVNHETQSIDVEYSIPTIEVLADTLLYPGTYYWNLREFGVSDMEGTPAYPVRSDVFILPADAENIRLQIKPHKTLAFSSFTPTPSRVPLPYDDVTGHTSANTKEINDSDYKPSSQSAYISHIGIRRGQKVVYVSIEPCRYDIDTKTTTISNRIAYTLSFESEYAMSVTDDVQKAQLHDLVLSCPENYLIITYEKYRPALLPFIEWRKQCGNKVKVVSADAWNIPVNSSEESRDALRAKIKSTIRDSYAADKNLKYVILAGGGNELPGELARHRWKNEDGSLKEAFTDYYYTCTDSDDDLERDLFSGRFMAYSDKEMRAIVAKIMTYEKLTPQGVDTYNKVAHLAFFDDRNHGFKKQDGVENMYCINTSEYLRDSAIKYNKTVKRIYTHTPGAVPTYSQDLNDTPIKLPPELLSKEFEWTSTPKEISDCFNDGNLYILYDGHGSVVGWDSPEFHIKNFINNTSLNIPYCYPMQNMDNLPVVFSMACSTGRFTSTGFAKTLLSGENGGAVAVIAAERESEAGFSAYFVRGMFNTFFHEIDVNIEEPKIPDIDDLIPFKAPSYVDDNPMEINAMGNILYNGADFCLNFKWTNSPYLKLVREVFHLFGDPGMVFHTKKPCQMKDVSFSLKTDTILSGFPSTKACLSLEELAYIGYYNETKDIVERFYGRCLNRIVGSRDKFYIVVQRYNSIPFIITYRMGSIGTSAPLASKVLNGRLSIDDCHEGRIGVSYELGNNEGMINLAHVEVRDLNNTLCLSRECGQENGSLLFEDSRLQSGFYVATLYEDGCNPVQEKVIIK